MLTNTGATLYHRTYDKKAHMDVWERTYLPAVWWYKSEESAVTTDGLKTADRYTVRIPDTETAIRKDDCLVYGLCEVDISTTRDLSGMDWCRVTSLSFNRWGDNPHIKVGGV